jgi:hypothetical protein
MNVNINDVFYSQYTHQCVSAGIPAASLLELWVWIPPGTRMPVVSVVSYQAEVSAPGWSLDQSSNTDCGVPECDHEALIMSGARPAVWAT